MRGYLHKGREGEGEEGEGGGASFPNEKGGREGQGGKRKRHFLLFFAHLGTFKKPPGDGDRPTRKTKEGKLKRGQCRIFQGGTVENNGD